MKCFLLRFQSEGVLIILQWWCTIFEPVINTWTYLNVVFREMCGCNHKKLIFISYFYMSCTVFMYLCINVSGFQHLLSYFIILKSEAPPQSIAGLGRLISVEISCLLYLYTVKHGEARWSTVRGVCQLPHQSGGGRERVKRFGLPDNPRPLKALQNDVTCVR